MDRSRTAARAERSGGAGLKRSAQGAMTLPGRYYTSEEIFRRERERIFFERWLYAGHVSELPEPGSYFLTGLDQESVIVLRDRAGEVRAFHNVCRHRGSRICGEEQGRFGGGIQCPYHAWTYALDGRLRGAPNMEERPGFDRADYSLHPAPLALWEGFIFISLSPRPRSFEETIAPLAGRFGAWHLPELRSVHRTVYDIAANWKLFFQNYNECYHCPGVHPLLNKLTPYRDSYNDSEEGPVLGGPMKMSLHGGSMTMTGRACAAPLGEVSGEDLGLVYYYTILPNMFLTLHPDYALVHRGLSQAPDRTRIYCDWFFHPDAIAEPRFDPSGAIEFWDTTNQQDWHLCTISQQGVSSRAYTPGPYAELESQLAAFDREYLRILGQEG